MNTIDLMNETKVSYYGNVRYNTSSWTVTLLDWMTKYSLKHKNIIDKIREINKTDEAQAKEMKKDNLPCATISGIFNSYRRADLIQKKNPIICIDIDKQENPQIEDWEKIKIDALKIKGAFLSSLSCRGEGIFVFIYYDITKDFFKVWNSLKKDFKEQLDINIDNSCKDICRLRFISYDKMMRIKPEVEMYDKELHDEPQFINIDNIPSDADTFRCSEYFIYKAIYYLIVEDGFRTNRYDEWLINCFRLSTLNYLGQVLFLLLSKKSDNFNYNTALKQFMECEKRNNMKKTALLYYLKLLKEKHGPKWYELINDYVIDDNKMSFKF